MTKKINHTKRLNDLGSAHETIFEPDAIYKKKDGGETLNLEEAELDPYGNPQLVRYSGSHPHSHYKEKKHLSFDPANPSERMLALEDVASMSAQGYQPNVYMDKFEAMTLANNTSSVVAQAIQNAKSSAPEE